MSLHRLPFLPGIDPENHSVTRMPAGLIVPHVYFSRLGTSEAGSQTAMAWKGWRQPKVGVHQRKNILNLAGWWFATCFNFPYIYIYINIYIYIGNIIIPTDELHHFSEG